MNQRIYNLSKWCRVPEGTAMPFPSGRKQRNVVIEVNCPELVNFWVLQKVEDVRDNPELKLDAEAGRASRTRLPGVGDENERLMMSDDVPWAGNEDIPETRGKFLCSCRAGRDTIDFAVDGPFWLVPDGGEAYVYSQDSLQHEVRILAPEVFTRIANRRTRNPEMEMMMWAQRQNLEARFAALAADTERRIKAASEGAKHKYAPERNIRPPLGRRLPDGATTREGLPESSARPDVRAEGQDRSESEDRRGVASEERVSSPPEKSRGKAKQTS